MCRYYFRRAQFCKHKLDLYSFHPNSEQCFLNHVTKTIPQSGKEKIWEMSSFLPKKLEIAALNYCLLTGIKCFSITIQVAINYFKLSFFMHERGLFNFNA